MQIYVFNFLCSLNERQPLLQVCAFVLTKLQFACHRTKPLSWKVPEGHFFRICDSRSIYGVQELFSFSWFCSKESCVEHKALIQRWLSSGSDMESSGSWSPSSSAASPHPDQISPVRWEKNCLRKSFLFFWAEYYHLLANLFWEEPHASRECCHFRPRPRTPTLSSQWSAFNIELLVKRTTMTDRLILEHSMKNALPLLPH